MDKIMGKEELAMLKMVIERQQLSRLNGLDKSFTAQFERDFAKYSGVTHALAVNSGSAALQSAVAACDIGPGDEVICTAFSYISSSGSVLAQNAIPVFADVDPATFCLDPKDIERKITDRTRAIIPVHIFGQPCDMDPIMDIAKKHNLYVIEDCCQAYGSKYKGKMVGTIGNLGVFSLQMSKQITCGEGGIVVSNDGKLFDKANLFANYGQYIGKPYNHHIFGCNFRLTELQSAVAIAQLKKIDRFLNERKRFVDLVEKTLKDTPEICLAYVPEWAEPHYWLYPMRYNEEKARFSIEEFIKRCKENDIHIGGYIPRPNYLEPPFKDKATYKHRCPFDCKWYPKKIEYQEGLCPVLEKAMKTLLIINNHHSRLSKEIRKIAGGIKKVLS